MLHFAWAQRVSPQSETTEAMLFDVAVGQFPMRLAAALPQCNIHTNEHALFIEHTSSGVALQHPRPFIALRL